MAEINNIYLVKDLARLSGHSVYTIKYYLKRGLITECGRSPETQFRYFDEGTLQRLSQIRACRRQGRGLAEIAHLLEAQTASGEASGTGGRQPEGVLPSVQGPQAKATTPA